VYGEDKQTITRQTVVVTHNFFRCNKLQWRKKLWNELFL